MEEIKLFAKGNTRYIARVRDDAIYVYKEIYIEDHWETLDIKVLNRDVIRQICKSVLSHEQFRNEILKEVV